MKHRRVIPATIIVLAACAGTQSGGSTDQSSAAALTSADSTAIVELNGRLQSAARAGNWDAWGAEFAADPVRLPPNAPPLVGKSAVDAFNRASPKFSTFDITVTSVVGRGDLAALTGSYVVRAPAGADEAGKATPASNDEGKFIQILMKQADGSWRIARDIWNSNLPASPSTTR